MGWGNYEATLFTIKNAYKFWQKQKWMNEWRNGGTSERMNEKTKKKMNEQVQ